MSNAKRALAGRSYIGWIFMRPLHKWGIVRKRFALSPTRIDETTVVWLQRYYSFLTQEYGSGLHDGWSWQTSKRALNPMRLRGRS